jgi:hypothetical protein
MIPSRISLRCYGSFVSTTQHEERATCKMTPEQLLGLQSRARAKTLSPEISIIDPPNVIAEVLVEEMPLSVRERTQGPLDAIIGFSLFAAVTTAELLIGLLS